MEGISQSGRFTRDFLWRGFNDDARGHEVFNGMFPIIPGSRKTYTDFRFAQPGRWSKEHEDHWQPGDQFPFAYNVIRDPVTYTSWNVRAAGHTPGEACISSGSTLPFAATAAARQASGDPRLSLAERYSSKADYVAKVQAAAQALVEQRLLLPEDVAGYVQSAQTQTLLQ